MICLPILVLLIGMLALPDSLRLGMRARLDQALIPDQEPTIADPGDVVDWAQDRFYITETKRPIKLAEVQQVGLRLASQRTQSGRFRWSTILWSTIKKSGKTTIAALYQRWAAERWGEYGEIFHMGNKLGQAKDRAFKLTRYSIQLAPPAERDDWEIQSLTMTYKNHSFIQALPVNASGSAGGNQRLTTWTEAHGYTREENEKMWSEMQPVPTQFYSQRFIESYAGYIGESMLLWNIWQLGLAGQRLHDEYPFYGNEAVGLFAYIDQGEDARRLPWQLGEEGRKYYAVQRAIESPTEFARLHGNDWVYNVNALISMPLWDRLAQTIDPPRHGEMVVVGADASVSGDCTALVVIYMRQESDLHDWVAHVVECHVWEPEDGIVDYDETIKTELFNVLVRYHVAAVVYDEYQLHDMMTSTRKAYTGTVFEAFGQGAPRLKADTQLVARIKHERLVHNGDPVLREHVANANGKVSDGEKRVRIVKRDQTKHIDAIVAISMAVQKGFELVETESDGEWYY